MLSEQQLAALPNELQGHFKQLERDFVDRICKRIGDIGSLSSEDITATDLHRLNELSRIGFDVAAMEKELAGKLKISEKAVYNAFVEAAEEEYSGIAYDMAKIHRNVIPFAENEQLQTLIESISRATSGEIKNMSQTTGFVNARKPTGVLLKNVEWQDLPTYYQNAVDYAILQIRAGQADFHSAIRKTIETMSDYGLRYAVGDNGKVIAGNNVTYASGYTRRLDSSVRSAILGGQARLSQAQAELVGERIQADGYEITWHSGFRPTHDFGGKQFSFKAFESEGIRDMMDESNCYHRKFPILLDISTPAYSKKQLDALNAAEAETHEWNGKQYNRYQATQVQRRYETAIRQYKDRAAAYEAAAKPLKEANPEAYKNFKEAATAAKGKVATINAEYARFSKAMGVDTQPKRATVSGYTRGKGEKTLEKEREILYNNVRKQIAESPKKLNIGNQKKHIKSIKGYIEGKSYIYGDLTTAQELVNNYTGTGKLEPNSKGGFEKREIVYHNSPIGVSINNKTGKETETNCFKIHYGKSGTHIVPKFNTEKR